MSDLIVKLNWNCGLSFSGVNAGEEIVTSGVFKLRNGAAVQVNNTVQPANDPKPKPEDN